jgi:hypothetical protein
MSSLLDVLSARDVSDAVQFLVVVSGGVGVFVAGAIYLLYSKLRKFQIGFELPPRCALVTETFVADTLSTGLQLSVAKGDLVQVLKYASHYQEWWKVRETGMRKEGYVPTRCLKMISREEEHMYQTGIVWAGAVKETRAMRQRQFADEEDGAADSIPVSAMDLFQLKQELRSRGYLNPRGDVRRLRAALERMIRDEAESAVAKKDRLPPCAGELTVVVGRCVDLLPSGEEGAQDEQLCNPFVTVWLGDEQSAAKKKTATKKSTSLDFNEEMTFKIFASEAPETETDHQMQARLTQVANECVLCVNVWGSPSALLSANTFLGEAKIDLVEAFGKEWLTKTVEKEVKLVDPDFRVDSSRRERRLKERGAHFHDQLELGRLLLTATFKKREKRSWLNVRSMMGGNERLPDAQVDSDRLCPAGHQLAFRKCDELLASRRAQLPPCDGILAVLVHKCAGLLATDLAGLSDPFVKLTLGGKSKKTKSVKGTLDPVFCDAHAVDRFTDSSSAFTWNIKGGAPPSTCALSLTVMNKSWAGTGEFIGETKLDLCSVFKQAWLGPRIITTLHLTDPTKKTKSKVALGSMATREQSTANIHGTITVELHFTASGSPATAEPSQIDQVARGLSTPGLSSANTIGGSTISTVSSILQCDPPDDGIVGSDVMELEAAKACFQCFVPLRIGEWEWECAAGCDFTLCRTCAAESTTGPSDGLLTLLSDRVDAALAHDFRDTQAMQGLADECNKSGFAHPSVSALRQKLASSLKQGRTVSAPPLSPAEARRRRECIESPRSHIRSGRVARLALPTVDEGVDGRQVVSFQQRLQKLMQVKSSKLVSVDEVDQKVENFQDRMKQLLPQVESVSLESTPLLGHGADRNSRLAKGARRKPTQQLGVAFL